MKILILTNFGMGLYKFRKELISKFIQDGNRVYSSYPNDDYTQRLNKLGCLHFNTRMARRGTNPIDDLKTLFQYIRIIRNIKPDVVLTYTIKPNIYGGLACRLAHIPYITNVTGLGTTGNRKGFVNFLVNRLYKLGLRKACCVFFQNQTNRAYFLDNGLYTGRSQVIPGSGVNLDEYEYMDYPSDHPVRFLFIGRVMKDKGINELLEAAMTIKEEYPETIFDIVGFVEEEYDVILHKFEKAGIIHFHGQQDSVRKFIRSSHAIVLPSYHEGTSNVLLEAAASGRPVIASNIPGCIETFTPHVSGIPFEIKNVGSLAEALRRFLRLTHEEKKQMGIEGRKKVAEEYDRQIIIEAYLNELNSVRKNHAVI